MVAKAAVNSVDTFSFTDRHFEILRKLIGEHTGISLSEHKRDLLYGRLTRRLRDLQLAGFDEYCRLLMESPDTELEHFINAVTTNLTAFFREKHHFDYLEQTLIPELSRTGQLKGMRIWSAGCSTGEEPYSIAMILRENIPAIDSLDIRILATDLDTNVVKTAGNGIYDEKRVEGMASQRLKRWFQSGTGPNNGKVRVHPDLQKIITFRKLNLMHAWPMRGQFDLIFCRNVVIYFDKPTQKRLFERYAELLKPNGHLVIGHSESLHNVSSQFELIRQTIYRKTH
ncbi:MAG: protein-glutamate O-methyltransferase CheR [Gammaproteobacteria bacterium]|nr:protein-glutamate O-methyltransferase CheR [Gammaproteobacteria bacterium]